jgi:hypothetical protein
LDLGAGGGLDLLDLLRVLRPQPIAALHVVVCHVPPLLSLDLYFCTGKASKVSTVHTNRLLLKALHEKVEGFHFERLLQCIRP